MSILRILYDINASWEIDYIHEIFSEHDFIFTPMTKENFENPKNYTYYKNIIVVFSVNVIPYKVLENFLKTINPLGIVILSDEYGVLNKYHHGLHKYSKFTLRNYFYRDYDDKDNIFHFPLGYISGFIDSKSTNIDIKKSSERSIKWSFVGNIKNIERYEMIEKFKKLDNYYIDDSLHPSKMSKIYLNSIFVPNGKGNTNLDCFRLYEASICGAIPVVVCKDIEIWKKIDNPPWIFASDWDEAISKCEQICQNEQDLNKKQSEVINWWKNNMKNLKLFLKKYIK